jgi:hypothetical protein
MANGRKAVKDPLTGDLKMVPRKSPPRKDSVFRRLEESVPREEMLAILGASADERAQVLLMKMMDPSCRKHSLPHLASLVGLSYPQVLQMITKFRLDEGMLRMSAHVPQVMEDVAVDAQSKEVTCGSCKGFKNADGIAVIPVVETIDDPESKKRVVVQRVDGAGNLMWERCLVCDGVGTLRKIGDADSRKLLFETLKLTGRTAPLVVQQFNGAGGSMEDAVAATHQILDAQVVKPEVPTT